MELVLELGHHKEAFPSFRQHDSFENGGLQPGKQVD